MATLTATQIATLAQQAGFPTKEINTAVGVAMAESGGNPGAHNSKPPDDSYGLWQINMLGALGPDRRKRFGISKNEQLFDPAINAKAAHIIWKDSGWNAWTTYTSGKYKGGAFNPNGAPAIDAGKVGDAVGELNPLAGVPAAINAFGTTVFKGFANMQGIAIGIALLVVGVILLVISGKTAKKIGGAAVDIIPGGAALRKVVK
jgi:hypothetical protein